MSHPDAGMVLTTGMQLLIQNAHSLMNIAQEYPWEPEEVRARAGVRDARREAPRETPGAHCIGRAK